MNKITVAKIINIPIIRMELDPLSMRKSFIGTKDMVTPFSCLISSIYFFILIFKLSKLADLRKRTHAM